MRKICLALMCLASATMFAACSSNGNAGNGSEQQADKASAKVIDTKDIMEPIFLEQWEYTTEGYQVLPEIVKDVEAATGIVDFGRVKGFDIQNALSFTGEGDRSDITDGFMFEFVPKDGKKFGHNVFEAYAKALWDKCIKVADEGQLKNSCWADAKVITFEESIKVVDKKQDRKKASWYYAFKGEQRYIEIIERQFSEDGFGYLYVQMKHM